MAVVYSIRNWNDHFEVAQSRKVAKMHWVATPCKHDGKSFRRLMLMPDGPAIYGAWILIVQIAAKCPVRGILADEDGPLSSEDLHIKTGCPLDLFNRALDVLASKPIGWIMVSNWEPDGSDLPPHTEQTKQYQPTNPTATTATSEPDPAGGLAGGNGFVSESAAPAAKLDPSRPLRVHGWGAVADRLGAMGASRWREAIAEAKECGCDWPLALKLIDHGTAHGYG